ncbi:MAG: DNA polymerase III subunit gamma/tau [Candidatus Eremiobacteraeota bacterium]|nr:DNA polymerase III subunit gamma/tau [Candidatus Eremiobacteraeota bacterium]
MSLYRTWRPLSFADLVGQDSVVRTLTTAIESGKLAHAYLFSGPRGSGKTSAAKILARCINCLNGPTATPDNTCENCRAMLAGTALDVLEIDAASNRGIDEIRALREAVKFAPSSMRMKVYIIDEAHMLTKEGANAFLKTLEEPPPHAVFILATTEPEKLPVTILSRCQRYAFRRIAIPVMIDKMRTIAGSEGIDVEEAALAAIAYRADGGLRDALTMLEQAAAFAGGETMDVATLDLAFGATGRDVAQDLLEATLARDAATALEVIDSASNAGTDMHVLMRSLIAAFRNLMVARVDPELLARDLAPEDADRAQARAQHVSQATLVRALRVLTDAMSLSRSGGNPRLEIETALLRLILAGEDPSLDGVAARVAAIEERLDPPRPVAMPAPAPKPVPNSGAAAVPVAVAASAATPRFSLQQVRAAWQSIRSKVESEYQPLRGPLSGATVDEVTGTSIVVVARNNVDAAIVRERVALIEAAAADVLGSAMKITLRVDHAARPKGSAPGGMASVSAGGGDPDDADALFNYASERIRER